MIRTASPDDLPALRTLFARANDAPYDLVAVAEEKCFGLGVAGEPNVRVWGDMEGAVVTCGRYVRILAVDRDARRRGVGSALLRDAEERGASVIAAEAGNYFTPGVVDTDETSMRFLQNRGYVETASTHNLDVASRRPDDPTTRRPTHEESPRVLAFIETNFGRIWRFEAAKAFDTAIPQMFITEENDTITGFDRRITGFAVHDVNNRGLGFFGPTGVAKELRGRGIGCRLLHASLADLHRLGYPRAVIPWTDAFDFYRKCSGAEPAHRFIAFAKPQP